MKAIRENSYSQLSTSTLVPVFSREDRKVGTARGWYDSRIATSVNCLTSSSGVSRTESLIAQGRLRLDRAPSPGEPAGTAVRLQFGGLGCVSAGAPSWSFPVGCDPTGGPSV